ncbi:MAG: ABC transporter ATP-binding protein [Limnochordaceae bacterium]|nr:ABC transporter ATP-binding protein [Limnochordaceae bacterium]
MAYHSGALLFRLLRESRPYARYYVLISLGFMISSVAGLGIADSLRRLVDAAAQHSTALLWSGLLVGLGGFTLSELLSFGMRYMQDWLDQTSGEARQRQLVKRVHEISYDYCLNKHSGDIISRIMDNALGAQSGVNSSVIRILRSIADVVTTLAYLIILSMQLAVVTFVSIIGASSFLVLVGPVMRRLWNQRWAQEGKVSSFVQDDVQGAEIIKSLSLYRWIMTRFDALYRPILRIIWRTKCGIARLIWLARCSCS